MYDGPFDKGEIMIRTPLDKAYVRRTLRELYSHSASTAKDELLDPAWDRSVDIYPGMGVTSFASASSGASNLVSLPNAAGDIITGLIGVYIAPTYGIDEVRDQGINSVPVWVLSPGSEFEVLAPAFDSALAWTFPTDGSELLVTVMHTGANRGKLVPTGTANSTTKPVARAIRRPATDVLVIAGLNAGAAY